MTRLICCYLRGYSKKSEIVYVCLQKKKEIGDILDALNTPMQYTANFTDGKMSKFRMKNVILCLNHANEYINISFAQI